MKQLIRKCFLFVTLLAIAAVFTTTSLYAQGSGLSRPVRYSQAFYNWQQFDAPVYFTDQKTMNGLGFTPVVMNDTDFTLQQNPIIYIQSDLVTTHETDSARNYSVLGFYYTFDKWARLDTIRLISTNYFAGQILNL